MRAGSAGEEAQYQMTNTYLLTPTNFNLVGTHQLERDIHQIQIIYFKCSM
jgi:hypothetical protein